MKRDRTARVLKFVVLGVVALAVFGAVVMGLWNWLMPAIFGLSALTFWQALGLLLLCRILFGRLGGPGGRTHWRRRMAERWSRMTPEEREKFMQGMKKRCFGFESETTGPAE